MNFDTKQEKVINIISKELGISPIEAEKALDGYYKAINLVIKEHSPARIDMKHLGKMFYSQKILDRENAKENV